MDVREKLVKLIENGVPCPDGRDPFGEYCDTCRYSESADCSNERLADYLISHDVTVQEHGYWETVVEVMDNTVCGNGVKIEYKRCSRCKNPAKFFEDDFCGNCGAKLDLPEPPKGE